MNTSPQKVYIVDDSVTISNILKKVISNIDGVEATDFQMGEDMLNSLETEAPFLIFLDYFLDTQKKGYMNGEEVFQQLKKNHPDVPVVMITGMTDDKKLEKLKSVGFDHIIHKDQDEVFEEVLKCVENYR
ncbi:MAG: response regulator [Crocinitomicaceae bacterium]